MSKLSKAILVFVGLTSTVAGAQSPDVPLRGQDHDPRMPAPAEAIPEKQGEGSLSVKDATGRNLSDRLNTSDGVLQPKGDPDPGIRTTPPEPNPNSTPVIKPPGSPGGDQSIKPK